MTEGVFAVATYAPSNLYVISDDQLAVMDELIDAMDLSAADK